MTHTQTIPRDDTIVAEFEVHSVDQPSGDFAAAVRLLELNEMRAGGMITEAEFAHQAGLVLDNR